MDMARPWHLLASVWLEAFKICFKTQISPACRPAGDYIPYERSLLKIPNNVATSVQGFCGACKNFLMENCSRQRSWFQAAETSSGLCKQNTGFMERYLWLRECQGSLQNAAEQGWAWVAYGSSQTVAKSTSQKKSVEDTTALPRSQIMHPCHHLILKWLCKRGNDPQPVWLPWCR